MSGICAILNLSDAAVNGATLKAMVDSMRFRGSDASHIWSSGNVGFGHTLLRTSFESEFERQPFSMDGRVWICADARIDGRGDLRRKLAAHGRRPSTVAFDAELILHAYHVWGGECVGHLIGDFAFMIWDGEKKQLFCARDHFGVKPFFYAHLGNALLVSNTLDTLKDHPDISGELNDLAVADFLLFDENQAPATTVYRDIQRLLGGHTLVWNDREGLKITRYWQLDTNREITYRKASDYVEHFSFLLEEAVRDRLRVGQVGVQLSGGLDSTSVAAVVVKLLRQKAEDFRCTGHTIVYDHLIPDEERRYARLAAEHLRIPMLQTAADDYAVFEPINQGMPKTPEPSHMLFPGLQNDCIKAEARLGRVVLTGWDGDALISESLRPYSRWLLQSGQYARLSVELAKYFYYQRGRVVPPRWKSWLSSMMSTSSTRVDCLDGQYPNWLNRDFESRLDLQKRWAHYCAQLDAGFSHRFRPYAYSVYQGKWEEFFEQSDPAYTHSPVEYRHPLMDLRLVEYCLSLPLVPWVMKKFILRESVRGILPEAVRLRPKTPLMGSPLQERLKTTKSLPDIGREGGQSIWKYLDRDRLPTMAELNGQPESAWVNTRPFGLHRWLA